MANVIGVVVTLTPVYSPDTLPFRSLTFLSSNDTVPVGRASKSETKNLVPSHDNGWFDSRVMSREHAVIGVKMEDKTVYVRDHGSLHGTQLNDVKITPKQNTTVTSGDVLTFGSEISRGAQTFRPIAVRLDCQWHEKRIVPATTKPTTNTFSVPDEEDDVVEVTDYKAVSAPQKSSPWSDSSDMEYGSDMSRPFDLTSPITSPEIKVSQLPTKPLNDATVAASAHQTIFTTSEAVVPPSSPPVFCAASPEQSEDENQSEFEEEEGGSESEDSTGEEQKGMFDDDSEDSEDDHYEGSDWGEDTELCDAQAPAFSVFEGEMARRTGSFKVNEVESSACDENQATSQVPNQPNLTNQTPAPGMVPQMQSCTSTQSAQQGFTWPDYLLPRVPSPSDKAMAKPMEIPAPAVTPSLAPALQPYSHFPPANVAIQAWASRNQGPSNSTFNEASALTNSFVSNNANESFPFGPHRSSGGYLRHMANDVSIQCSPGFYMKPLYSGNEEPEGVKKVEKPVHTPTTRVSVTDIVEANTQSHPSSSNKLKRKANDFEADLKEDSQETSSSQDSITDAQPRPDMQELELTQSQIPDTQPIKEVAHTDNEEHRRKRVKQNQAYTFMKYAAVAAIGAAVGSIGTIAGLSSLPADFFN
uniref:Uncharacterized protein C3H7.13 n=1 Tax=Talaromyces marneffei PM1 TaxID=1077442 RepID=A0A093VBD9_TALMA